ncbi:MAG: SPFH domain-containing protein [Clostridiales bacterium]|nr:SPFH domain-containing protein [Clostridiales bacterium]
MAELVKFTGNNAELFVRECADGLHAKAQVVVPETHTVLLIKDGVVSEALGAGRHNIFDTENGVFRQKKDSDVATVEFVFISKTAKLPMLWGTATPIKTRDPQTGVPVSIGINGELEFRVKTPKQFYLELVGADTEYSVDKLKKRLLSRLMSIVEPIVAEVMRTANISYTEFTEKKVVISEKLKAKLAEIFASEYGLELCSFTVASAIISDADIMAIERKRDELKHAQKVCPSCGSAVSLTAKFCAECGASLVERVCECGAKLDANAKFCSQCGKKVK